MRVKLPIKQSTLVRHDGQAYSGEAYSGEAYSGEAYSGEAYDSIVGRHRLHRRAGRLHGLSESLHGLFVSLSESLHGLFVSLFGSLHGLFVSLFGSLHGLHRRPGSLHGLFVSQFGSLHGRGVHVGLEWFDGSRTSDEEERDGLQRGKQLAGIL